MAVKVVLAMILGALAGLVAAGCTWLDLTRATSGDDARAVVIVQAAWQYLRHPSRPSR